MKRFAIIASSLLLMLVAAIVLRVFKRPVPPISVTIAFCGYTNDAAGARFGTFRVTNHSEVTVWRWNGCRIEGEPQPLVRSMLSIGPSVCLGPGEWEVIALPAPTNQGAWRAMMRRAMLRDFSWGKAAEGYVALYRQLLAG